jgi:predicted Zn-dependent protease
LRRETFTETIWELLQPLSPEDQRHVEAAKGWCKLNAFVEADAELDNITASLRAHPSVLEVRWQVCANLQKWDGALDIASAIVKLVPDWPCGWIYRANSLTGLNRHQEAYDTLTTAIERFPSDEIIHYDLACACCALGRLDEARTWLRKAIDAGGKETKLWALDDPDLEPLWQRVGEL